MRRSELDEWFQRAGAPWDELTDAEQDEALQAYVSDHWDAAWVAIREYAFAREVVDNAVHDPAHAGGMLAQHLRIVFGDDARAAVNQRANNDHREVANG